MGDALAGLRTGKLIATALKAVLGVCVFTGTVGAWQVATTWQRMHTPLPDADGRQGACVVWFLGSSSIHKWTSLQSDMAPWIAKNRGVDGALIDEVRQRFTAQTAMTPPEAIVLYAGENDLARGLSPQNVVAQLDTLVGTVQARLPRVPLFVVSLKPSPTRWPMRPQQRAVNAVLAAQARDHGFTYVDIAPDLFVHGALGDYYQPDGVHLTPPGYAIWARDVHAALAKGLPAATRCAAPALARRG